MCIFVAPVFSQVFLKETSFISAAEKAILDPLLERFKARARALHALDETMMRDIAQISKGIASYFPG